MPDVRREGERFGIGLDEHQLHPVRRGADKRSFATVWNNHHGDGRYALICAAPDGMQAMLVETDPERFYVPPYVGHRGWIGVRLDRGFDRDEIAGILEDAYAEVAPPKLVAAARSRELREKPEVGLEPTAA